MLLAPSLALLQPCPGPAGAGRVAVNYFMVLTWRLPEARRPRCVWPPRRQGAAASSGRRPPRLRGPRHVRRSSLGAARTSHLTHGSLSTFNPQGGDTEARDSAEVGEERATGALPGHCPALLGPCWPFTMRGAGCRRPRAGGPLSPVPRLQQPGRSWWPGVAEAGAEGEGPCSASTQAALRLWPLGSPGGLGGSRRWGRCPEGGPRLGAGGPDMEPGPPEGGLWPQPASCCCSVFGPAWRGRWAREGQPVLSREFLETGRGGGPGARIQLLTGNGWTGSASPPGRVTCAGWACEACVATLAQHWEPPSSPLASGVCRG